MLNSYSTELNSEQQNSIIIEKLIKDMIDVNVPENKVKKKKRIKVDNNKILRDDRKFLT